MSTEHSLSRKNALYIPIILLSVFLLSVLVRLPSINHPLSTQDESKTAIALRILQIWNQEGIQTHSFWPILNYAGQANKNINNSPGRDSKVVRPEGNYYYTSHPPFAYYLPHFLFTLFNTTPSVFSLQIFFLCINLISAVFIYLIVSLLGNQRPRKSIYPPALVGFSIYLFSPPVLWFQCNTYMSDTFAHLFFILSVYTVLKLLMRKQYYSVKYLIYFSVFLFLMIYTSWLGIFFAFGVFVYSLIQLRYERVFLPLISLTAAISTAALWLIWQQYTSINGPEAYLTQLFGLHVERKSFFSFLYTNFISFATILKNYVLGYLPVFLLLAGFGWLVLTKAKMKILFTKNGYRFLWLSTLPVVLFHVFLPQYTHYGYTSLFGSLFLAVLIGIVYDKLKQANTLSNNWLHGGVITSILLSLFIYYIAYQPLKYFSNKNGYKTYVERGRLIQSTASENEVVFFLDAMPSPQTVFYANRNIQPVSSEAEAASFLQWNHIEKGIIFYWDYSISAEEDPIRFYRIDLSEE